MSESVLQAISIRGEEGPIVDFTLTGNGLLKSIDTITESNDMGHLSDDGTKEAIEGCSPEHKCDNCSKSFKRFNMLSKHLALCHFNSNLRAKEMINNIKKVKEDAVKMENDNKCYCSGESYDTLHCNKCIAVEQGLNHHKMRNTGEKSYTCFECNKSFSAKKALSLHLMRHAGEKPYVCNKCGKRFIREIDLRYHSKTHERPFSCDLCEENFKTNKKLEQHIRNHSSNRKCTQELKLKSKECKAIYSTEEGLNTHYGMGVNIDNEESSIKLENRSLKTESKSTVLKPLVGATIGEQTSVEGGVSVQEFIKEELNKTSTENLILENEDYTVISIENETIKAEPVDTVSETVADMMLDNPTSYESGTEVPKIMNNIVTEASTAYSENNVQKSTEERHFTCDICEKKFLHLSRLKYHCRIHTGEKPYKCTECNQSFAVKTVLNRHMMRHTGEKPYSCTECSQKFAGKQDLNRHMNRHTGEKSYICTECNKCFALKQSLNLHMRRHAGEKPHGCKECGKRFLRAIELCYHSKIHERPFTCDQCEEKFKTNKELKQHIRIHLSKNKCENESKEHKYKNIKCKAFYATEDELKKHYDTGDDSDTEKGLRDCAVCDKEFDSAKTLNSHILEVHKVQSLKLNNTQRAIKLETNQYRSDGSNRNPIKNITTNNKNVNLPEKYEDQISIGSSLDLQFIKKEESERSIDQLLFENEICTDITVENESIKMELETDEIYL